MAQACKLEIALLKKVLSRHGGGANATKVLNMLKNSPTYLCVKCQQILLKQDSLEKELSKVNSQLQSQCEALICCLNALNNSNLTTTAPERVGTGSKRPATESSIPGPTTPVRSSSSSSPDVSVIITAFYLSLVAFYANYRFLSSIVPNHVVLQGELTLLLTERRQ